jgi:cytochrome c biogenesis protein CcmG/thiol:disulfide interchange protein DsbE
MRRFLVTGGVSCLVIALILVLALGLAEQNPTSSLDAQVLRGHFPLAPDARQSLPLLTSGGRESLADLRGKIVLINVFASWCQPCAGEAPVLRQIQHVLTAHDGTVLGVTYLDTASDSLQFLRQHHLDYPALHDVNGDLVHAFVATGVPESYLINRQGRVVGLWRYELTEQWLRQVFPRALQEASA